jgi:Spy/CpxP family protein refolding chaperone
MNRTALLAAVVLAAVTMVFAQAKKEASSPDDAKLDKIIQQNELILQQQADILKQLEEVRTQLGALRRRLS